jgi:hypothetical protein
MGQLWISGRGRTAGVNLFRIPSLNGTRPPYQIGPPSLIGRFLSSFAWTGFRLAAALRVQIRVISDCHPSEGASKIDTR